MGRLLLCAAGTLAVLCCTSGAVQPPAQTTTEPFDADAFTSSFADVVDEFKAKAVSAVADQLSVYMDKIGVTKVVHEVMDTKLVQYLNTTGHALDDMITFFTEDDAEARLEGVVSKLADKIGFSLDALNGDATPSSTTTATDSSSPASIGDVVVATVGFDISHAANIAAVQGKTLSVSGAAGFHFQAGLNIAKLDDFVFAVGGGASVGFSGADVNTGNASSTTATVQEVLARVADTTAVGGGKFWSKLDTLVTSTVSVDFVANPSDLTGFAYKVSITLPAFSAIKEMHVYLRHPHWGCLPSHPEAMYNPTVMGWGVTLYSGKPSGMVADVKNLWTNLKASWGEMAALKGTWNSQWGTGSLSIGDTITVGTVGPSISFSQSACTAAGTPTTAPSSSTSEAVATVTSVAENLVKVINVVTPMILNAEFSAYFCMGECSTSHIDITQTISGTATFKVTSAHDGVEVDLVVPGLTVGGLTHVATEGLPGSVKSAFRGLATPIAGLGVAESSVMIKLTTSGITISVVGEPSFPSTGQSDFQKVMETLSNVKLGVKTSFSYTGDIVMELDVATPPDTGNKVFAIVNVAGTMGFTLFTKVVVEPEPDLELGVSLPVKLCVEKCGGSFSNSRFLYLDGSVSLALSGSAQLVEGQLTMDGWWAKALGIPFVHVGNVLLGIGMDLKVGLPTKLEIGGAVCLGSETDCLGHTGTRIEGHVYVGVSATEPDSNYFTAMINQLTIGQVLSLVAEYAPGVSSVSIPSKVGQSGIYPYGGSAANAACDAQRSAGGSPTDLDMDCFAYASFNAGTDDKVLAFRSGSIVVPAGLAFAGRLNFYGWEFAVKAAVSPTAFLITATMDKVSIKKGSTTIMEIGEYLDTSHNVQGGGRFLVSVTADPATALVGIYGAFTIPVLQSYGELQVTLNADVFEFESDLHLFNGALSSHAHVKWDWDLSYFTATLSDMNFGGIVKADHIGFTYDESKSYAEFSAKVTVLALIGVDTTIKVQNNVITFFASASLSSLLTMEVTGRAVLADPFLSSSFDLTVHLKPGDLAKKIGAAVKAAALAVANTVQQALSDVETNLKNTFNDIKNEFNGALNALKNEAGKILDDINAFANDVVSVLDSVPGLSDAIQIGEALASGDMSSFGRLTLGSLGMASTSHRIIDTGRRNKYGCPLLRQVWSECYGCCFWKYCKSKQSSDFPDVGCMKAVGKSAHYVKKYANTMHEQHKAINTARDQNKGLTSLLSGKTLPDPTVGDVIVQMPQHTAMPVMAVLAIETHRLSNTEGVTSGKAATHSSVALDMSSAAALEASLNAAAESSAASIRSFVMNDQAGVQPYLTAQGAQSVTYAKPILKAPEAFTVKCAALATQMTSKRPGFSTIDTRCRKGAMAVLLSFSDSAKLANGCGKWERKIVWEGFDADMCNGKPASVTQTITVLPGSPMFKTFPGTASVPLGQSYAPSVTGIPEAFTECHEPVELDYEDTLPYQRDGDTEWTVIRSWSIKLALSTSVCASTPTAETWKQTIRLTGGAPLSTVKYFGSTATLTSMLVGQSLFRIGALQGGYLSTQTTSGARSSDIMADVHHTHTTNSGALWSVVEVYVGLYVLQNTHTKCYLGRAAGAVVCTETVTPLTHSWTFEPHSSEVDGVFHVDYLKIHHEGKCLLVAEGATDTLGSCNHTAASLYIQNADDVTAALPPVTETQSPVPPAPPTLSPAPITASPLTDAPFNETDAPPTATPDTDAPTPGPGPSSDTISDGWIVGIVLLGLAGVAIVVGLVVFLVKTSAKKNTQETQNEPTGHEPAV